MSAIAPAAGCGHPLARQGGGDTSINVNTRGMHDLTDTILANYVVGAAR